VRARISTPPPAAYGTKIRTGFEGNGDWADAATVVTYIAAATAANRDHPAMASLPSFRYFQYRTPARQSHRRGAQITVTTGAC
jgi:hypothetical protein